MADSSIGDGACVHSTCFNRLLAVLFNVCERGEFACGFEFGNV